MNINQLKQSKYLKKEDVESPTLATIKSVVQENVAPDDKPEEIKAVIYFREGDLKPLVANWTNIQLIAGFLGEETDLWHGKQIVLYHDPNVSYGGKMIGGVRVRKPKTLPSARVPQAAPEPEYDAAEDLPF